MLLKICGWQANYTRSWKFQLQTIGSTGAFWSPIQWFCWLHLPWAFTTFVWSPRKCFCRVMPAVVVPLLTGEIFPGSAYSIIHYICDIATAFLLFCVFILPSLSPILILFNAVACCSGLHTDCSNLLLFLIIVCSPVRFRFDLNIFKTKMEEWKRMWRYLPL